MLLGNNPTESPAYVYGAITRSGTAFQRTSTSCAISNSAHHQQLVNKRIPQPHPRNPCQVSHYVGLASSAFARHYSRNHGCFLFLWVPVSYTHLTLPTIYSV